MVASGEGSGGGGKAQGARSTNWQVRNRQRGVKGKYRKWRSQRTYMHDPGTRSKEGGCLRAWGMLGGGGKG